MAIFHYRPSKNFNLWLAKGLLLARNHQDLMAMGLFLEEGATFVDLDSLIYQTLTLYYGTARGADDTIAVLQILTRRGAMFDVSKVRDWGEWPYTWEVTYESGRSETCSAVKRIQCNCSGIQAVYEHAQDYLTSCQGEMDIQHFKKAAGKVNDQILKMAKVEEKGKGKEKRLLGGFSIGNSSRYPWYRDRGR
jgi:hypothetical protein